MTTKIKGLLITHNDMDAAGCAIVTKLLLTDKGEKIDWEIKYCPATDADKALTDSIDDISSNVYNYILIGDISITEETAEALENIAKNNNIFIGLYDHHISNKLDATHRWCYIDTTNSACWLMYIKLHKEKSVFLSPLTGSLEVYLDWLMKSISRYDTWQWKTEPDSKAHYNYEYVSEGDLSDICKFIGVEEFVRGFYAFIIYAKYIKTLMPIKFFALRDCITTNKKQTIERILSDTTIKSVTMNNKKCGIMISDSSDFIYGNELLENIYKMKGVDISIMIYPRTRIVSVRTGRDDIDLSVWVKEQFGTGGGHRKAAGSKLDIDKMTALIHLYYISDPLTKEED